VAVTKAPFREAMFRVAVRNRLADRLVKEQGYSRSEAREAVRELDDATIEQTAAIVSPRAKVGAGGFIQFLLDFLESEAFARLLDILLGLFGGPVESARAASVAGLPSPPTGEAV
jgi:hypothetical protein